jgi:hypothetical protein
MSKYRTLFILALASLTIVAPRAWAWQHAWARPVAWWDPFYAPLSSVGLVETVVWGTPYRGSASVARDHRLVYSCGHLVYDNGRWASVFRFARAYHSYLPPEWWQYQTARGFYKLAGYTPFGFFNDFDDDFAVAYASANGWFGPPLLIHSNPIQALESNEQKMIAGYPADLDHTYAVDTGFYYLHRTGPFRQRYYDEDLSRAGGEYWREGVTTGGGNSGGPILVQEGGQYRMAGVLVSGSFLGGSGVYALGSEAEQLGSIALSHSTEGTSATRWAWPNGWIWDASSIYASRSFDFSSTPTQAMEVRLSLGIYTQRRGDIDAFVRSPAGRFKVVAWRNASDKTPNLILNDEDISDNFRFLWGSGVWQLYFRDVFSGSPSWFHYASLKIRSRWLR